MIRNQQALFCLRHLFTLAVVTASFGICLSLVVLFQQATIPQTTHGLQRRRQESHIHCFEHSQAVDQDDDAIVVDTSGPVVNPHPYDFIINNLDLCRCSNDSEEDPLILICVTTAPSNFDRRDRIRQTWAMQDNYRGISLRTIFVIGLHGNSQLQAEIAMEAQRYGDIAQENFIDTYE